MIQQSEISFYAPIIFLCLIFTALLINVYTLARTLYVYYTVSAARHSWLYLAGILLGQFFGNAAWTALFAQEVIYEVPHQATTLFFIRLARAFMIVQYQSIAGFMESVLNKHTHQTPVKKTTFVMAVVCVGYFIYQALFGDVYERFTHIPELTHAGTHIGDSYAAYAGSFFLFNILILPTFIRFFREINAQELPKLVRHYLRLLLYGLICPFLVAEFFIGGSFLWIRAPDGVGIVASVAALILAIALLYCVNIIVYRSVQPLLHQPDVIAHKSITFDAFKEALEQLGRAAGLADLYEVTLTFFKQQFNVPLRALTLYVCSDAQQTDDVLARFISLQSIKGIQTKIMVFDEIAFEYFYDASDETFLTLCFLKEINSDIFIPLYHQDTTLIGYINVAYGTRPGRCYELAEQAHMIIFTHYLSSVINVLRHNRGDHIRYREQKISDQLFTAAREASLYKEALHAFLDTTPTKTIGIFLYKNGKFSAVNDEARRIIPFNILVQESHPVARACLSVALRAESDAHGVRCLARHDNGTLYVVAGCMHENLRAVVVTLWPADIADTIAYQLHDVTHITDADYLMLVEKTKPGMLIEQFLPAMGPVLTPTKISLLKACLSRVMIHLEGASEDMEALVWLMHRASNRGNVYVIDAAMHDNDIYTHLYDIIRMTLGIHQHKTEMNGTLFLKNIEYLSAYNQRFISDALLYGIWRLPDTGHHIPNTMRLISTSNHHVHLFAHEGKFCRILASHLKKNTFALPTPEQLSKYELQSLIDGYVRHYITGLGHMCTINDVEKEQILACEMHSLRDLKRYIMRFVRQKTNNRLKNSRLADENIILPSNAVPSVLGDKHQLTLLWQKFGSHQKIALFLGVHRSSVYRHCRQFGIGGKG